MRCRVGDLAIVVRANYAENVGRIVETLSVDESGMWRVRSESALCTTMGHSMFAYCPDEWLRPIRDPGDDAQDETLQWLPVPEREGVAA